MYEYSGSIQYFIVPSDVDKIHVTAIGGDGGEDLNDDKGVFYGGKGCEVSAIVKVTPGSVLYIIVGGAGSKRHTSNGNSYSSYKIVSGGFNGGGSSSPLDSGAGGGGSTDMRRNSSYLGSRIIVAGGGGGGSASCSSTGGNSGYIGSSSRNADYCNNGNGSVPHLPLGGSQYGGGSEGSYNIPYIGSQIG